MIRTLSVLFLVMTSVLASMSAWALPPGKCSVKKGWYYQVGNPRFVLEIEDYGNKDFGEKDLLITVISHPQYPQLQGATFKSNVSFLSFPSCTWNIDHSFWFAETGVVKFLGNLTILPDGDLFLEEQGSNGFKFRRYP